MNLLFEREDKTWYFDLKRVIFCLVLYPIYELEEIANYANDSPALSGKIKQEKCQISI